MRGKGEGSRPPRRVLGKQVKVRRDSRFRVLRRGDTPVSLDPGGFAHGLSIGARMRRPTLEQLFERLSLDLAERRHLGPARTLRVPVSLERLGQDLVVNAG